MNTQLSTAIAVLGLLIGSMSAPSALADQQAGDLPPRFQQLLDAVDAKQAEDATTAQQHTAPQSQLADIAARNHAAPAHSYSSQAQVRTRRVIQPAIAVSIGYPGYYYGPRHVRGYYPGYYPYHSRGYYPHTHSGHRHYRSRRVREVRRHVGD